MSKYYQSIQEPHGHLVPLCCCRGGHHKQKHLVAPHRPVQEHGEGEVKGINWQNKCIKRLSARAAAPATRPRISGFEDEDKDEVFCETLSCVLAWLQIHSRVEVVDFRGVSCWLM